MIDNSENYYDRAKRIMGEIHRLIEADEVTHQQLSTETGFTSGTVRRFLSGEPVESTTVKAFETWLEHRHAEELAEVLTMQKMAGNGQLVAELQDRVRIMSRNVSDMEKRLDNAGDLINRQRSFIEDMLFVLKNRSNIDFSAAVDEMHRCFVGNGKFDVRRFLLVGKPAPELSEEKWEPRFPKTWNELLTLWRQMKPLQVRQLEEANCIVYEPENISLRVNPASLAGKALLTKEGHYKLWSQFKETFAFAGNLLIKEAE